MRYPKRLRQIRFIFLIFILVLVFVGCGEQGSINQAKNAVSPEEIIEKNTAYLLEYPEGKFAPEAREKLDKAAIILARRDKTKEAFVQYLELNPEGEFVDEAMISLAAFGHGFPDAPPFDPKKPGPHRLIVAELCKPGIGQPERYRVHQWQGMLPPTWTSTTMLDAVLIVFVRDEKVKSDSRRYDNGMEVFGYKIQSQIEIREVRRGEKVQTGILEGSDPVFPHAISSNQYPSITGSPVNYLAFEKWLLAALK